MQALVPLSRARGFYRQAMLLPSILSRRLLSTQPPEPTSSASSLPPAPLAGAAAPPAFASSPAAATKPLLLADGPQLGFLDAYRGCKDVLINYWKAWKLKRAGKARPLTGPELREVARADADFDCIKPVLFLLLLPFVGYVAPLYFLVFRNQAPAAMLTPAMREHIKRARAEARVAHGASLRKFLHLISDDYARRPPPPLVNTVYFKPEFAHKNPRTAGPAIAMRTTDSRPPQSMFDAITANRLNRAREAASPESIAPKVSVFLASSKVSHIRGVGSSVLIKGSGHIDWETYNQRPKRSLMQILEDDRRTYKMMTTEQLEALSLQRIQDFEQYGDDPLMWDRARQFREIEAARAEEVAKKLAAGLSLAEVEAAAAAAKSSEAADDVYSTKVPIAVMDGDKPLSVSELHAITPFFHYYITHYDLRANPLSALLRFTRFWALHEPRGQKLSDSKRLAMIAAVYSNAHLAQALDESYRVQGVDSLTRAELVEANYQRGMRSEGADITDDVLRRQLTTWLELHSTGEMVLPGTLLMYAPLLISPEPMTPEAVTQAQELLAEAQTIAPRKE